ncbi:MAG: TMEM165/GDT1 family protein [Candidatus Natronoplasma sp.]
MIWYLIVGITFSSVALAELGDKSHILAISLASKYEERDVFMGIVAGLAVITILGVAIGTVIFNFLPLLYVKLFASLAFIGFGLYTLTPVFLTEEEEEEEVGRNFGKGKTVSSSFFLSFISELGDKTQLVVIALTARFSSPSLVFIGAVLAFAMVTGISVALGSKLGEFIRKERLDMITSVIFLVLGAAFLIEALFLA